MSIHFIENFLHLSNQDFIGINLTSYIVPLYVTEINCPRLMKMNMTGIRLSDDLKDAGKAKARQDGRSFGSYVRFLIARDTGFSRERIQELADEFQKSSDAARKKSVHHIDTAKKAMKNRGKKKS